MDCFENIIPVQETDPCGGKRYSTKCVYSSDAFTLLDLPENTSLDAILNALATALNAQKQINDAQQLIIEDLEARVQILENP